MSAHKVHTQPPIRALFDRHFDREELAAMLGTDDEIALSLARRATWAPLADMLSRPGKGVRARVVEHAFAIAREATACECASLPPELPQLVELLHAGSLVVDDVEDGAKTRRGAPALHEIFGVPVAINAGSLLYFLPQVILSQLRFDAATALAMERRVTKTLLRCHHGQGLDLALTVGDLAPSELRAAVELTTSLKTGALLELSAALGAMAAHASPHVERALSDFAREMGIALQMLDDVSGFLSPARKHKALEDLAGSRPTWAWVIVAEAVDELTLRGLLRAARNKAKPETLYAALKPHLDVSREICRARIDAAVSALKEALGPLPSLEPLVREVRALEHGYV